MPEIWLGIGRCPEILAGYEDLFETPPTPLAIEIVAHVAKSE